MNYYLYDSSLSDRENTNRFNIMEQQDEIKTLLQQITQQLQQLQPQPSLVDLIIRKMQQDG